MNVLRIVMILKKVVLTLLTTIPPPAYRFSAKLLWMFALTERVLQRRFSTTTVVSLVFLTAGIHRATLWPTYIEQLLIILHIFRRSVSTFRLVLDHLWRARHEPFVYFALIRKHEHKAQVKS